MAAQVQALLRFLSQDAKVPLAIALGKVKDLQNHNLTDTATIAKAKIEDLHRIFGDEKIAKQIHNAAKRLNKKRSASDTATASPAKKRSKEIYSDPLADPVAFEESLRLPEPILDEDVIYKTELFTNRAPLVLAFAVILLKYTMPEQPLSSRLSLSQAVVSLNSRSKAVSIGLESGKSAEEEGFGEGQPTVKVMGREVRVMRRWGYEWRPAVAKSEPADSQATIESNPTVGPESQEESALWGLDLEALKMLNGPQLRGASGSTMPIHTAQSARAYLLKSFDASGSPLKLGGKKQTVAELNAQRERNLGLLLGALESLFESWKSILGRDELDKRAWSWYVKVRPEVASGQAGWGGKNTLRLSDILALRRNS